MSVDKGIEKSRNNSHKPDGLSNSSLNSLELLKPELREQPLTTFAPDSMALLPKIDLTGNVSKSELARAVESRNFKGQDAQNIAALYRNFDRLASFSNQGEKPGQKELNKADLNEFQKAVLKYDQQLKDAFELHYWSNHGMSKFASRFEYLSKKDILEASKQKSLSNSDKRGLELSLKYFDQLKSKFGFMIFSEEGIKVGMADKDLDAIANPPAQLKMLGSISESIHRTFSMQKDSTIVSDLYGGKNQIASISPDAVHQGFIGDCYVESAIAALAASNPESIAKIIKSNKNGSYSVTFPGANSETVTVTAPSNSELGLYNGGSKYGNWASVLEKAIGKLVDKHDSKPGYTPQEAISNGGWSEPILEILTGKNALHKEISQTSKEEIIKDLENCFKTGNRKAITAGIYGDPPSFWDMIFKKPSATNPEQYTQTNDGFYKKHEYAITGFSCDSNGNAKVTIFNPWNGKKGTTGGEIQIPIDTFLKNFSDYTFVE